jgi:hypothetical protein
MTGRAPWLTATALVLATACSADAPTRPDRHGQIESVQFDGVLSESGLLQVRFDVTFASDAGGPVAVRPPLLGTVENVTVNGTARGGLGYGTTIEVKAIGRQAAVGADIIGAVERYGDIAVITVPVWGSPSDARSGDPLVPMRGTITLPTPPLEGTVHWHKASPQNVGVEGNTLRLDGAVAMDTPSELVLALPALALPAIEPISDEARLDYFGERQAALDRADAEFDDDLEADQRRENLGAGIYWAAVGAEVAVPVLVAVVGLVRGAARRRRAVAGVPGSLSEPPGPESPAVVALLDREGNDIGFGAAAATILLLAHDRRIEIEGGGGGRYILDLGRGATGRTAAEQIVLRALRASSREGRVEGPPLRLDPDGPWWKQFKRATLAEAKHAGLVARRYRSGLFVTATAMLTVTTFPLWGTTPEAAVAGLVVGGVLALLPFVGGYRLTSRGHRVRAMWLAFRRYLHDHAEFGDAEPAGVVVWGPYLVYGVALDAAPTAAEALAPAGGPRSTRATV